jgi:hypothetical protein
MKRQMRLYRFVVEVLDEPDCSDADLEQEFQEMLDGYFEAFEVRVELVDADDVIGIDAELGMAEA